MPMKRFPSSVLAAMQSTGAMATCVAVSLDGGAWQAAFFMQLAGPESKLDRRAMSRGGPFSMGLETDLIETASGAVVMLRPQLHTRDDDPLVMEILLTPGVGGMHHEVLGLLSQQAHLSWFYGDGAGWILHAQSLPLGDEHRDAFAELQRGALRHDTLVRLSATYDASEALSQVVRHYELRAVNQPEASRRLS